MDPVGINVTALTESGLFTHSKSDYVGPRKISRYILEAPTDDRILDRAVTSITRLLDDNPVLIPTFPIKNLREQLNERQYLILNGKAVSLSEEPEPLGDIHDNHVDSYFALSLIKSPARCSMLVHVFEKTRAENWRLRCATCPAGNHPIGDLELDYQLQHNILRYTENKREMIEKERMAEAERAKEKKINDFIHLCNLIEIMQMRASIETLKQRASSLITWGEFGLVGTKLAYGVPIAAKKLLSSGELKKQLCKFTWKAVPLVHLAGSLGLAACDLYKSRKAESATKEIQNISSVNLALPTSVSSENYMSRLFSFIWQSRRWIPLLGGAVDGTNKHSNLEEEKAETQIVNYNSQEEKEEEKKQWVIIGIPVNGFIKPTLLAISGVAGMIPMTGYVITFAIDATLLGVDLYRASRPSKEQDKQQIPITQEVIDNPYIFLQLENDPLPNKNKVDKAYHQLLADVQDAPFEAFLKLGISRDKINEKKESLTQFFQQVIVLIYVQRRWLSSSSSSSPSLSSSSSVLVEELD